MTVKSRRTKRLCAILGLWLSLGLAAGLVLYAMKQHINLFFTPTQLVQGSEPAHLNLIRVGGWVQPKSIAYNASGDTVTFRLSDGQHSIVVYYQGLLPDLFREGQGVVAQGSWHACLKKESCLVHPYKAHFVATQVLAKHDENYRPPELNTISKRAIWIGNEAVLETN